MIAPKSEKDQPSVATDVTGDVHSFFDPEGPLDRACSSGQFPYEYRHPQVEMAVRIAESCSDGGHLAVEAGTGVGKSFAYLVPLLFFVNRTEQRVVVSTHTISLQQQLIEKDIPFLKRHLPFDFNVQIAKGMGNYLCERRFERARRNAGDLFVHAVGDDMCLLEKWLAETNDGTLQSLERQPASDIWGHVCVEEGNCLANKCPYYKRCFFIRDRQRLVEADLIVVNHHLYFSHVAVEMAGGAILPAHGVAVLDEAHTVEDTASEHFGLRLSQYTFEYWLRRLYIPDKNRGLLALLRKGEAAHKTQQIWALVHTFMGSLIQHYKLDAPNACTTLKEPVCIQSHLVDRMRELDEELRILVDETEDADIRAELAAIRRKGGELRAGVENFTGMRSSDHVYWMQREGRRQQLVLYSAPVEIGDIMKEALFSVRHAVIMTSATLAVNHSFDYFLQRVGGEDAVTLQVGSPFDYGRQMRILLEPDMPDPSDNERYVQMAAAKIGLYVNANGGQAFVLFTSIKMLKGVLSIMGDSLRAAGFELFIQGDGMSRHRLLEAFKTSTNGILFGLASFWTGVDVPGEALRHIIITKLPFAVPDRPLIKARMDRIREKGGDPFREYSLPEAILKLRQGTGRLIRTATDQGTVYLLDSRVHKKWYGRYFLRSLPECPVSMAD